MKHNRPDTFIIGYAVGDGVSICRIDEDGRIGVGNIVPIDTKRGAFAESSGPSDNWITPDGAYLYQICGNASKLVGYDTEPDGSLNEIVSVGIPYNSPQGLAGF